MPRSPLRRKRNYTPPPAKTKARLGSPRWLVPLMLLLFLVGLVWIITWYLSEQAYPIGHWGPWNLVAGFGFIATGFALSTQWR